MEVGDEPVAKHGTCQRPDVLERAEGRAFGLELGKAVQSRGRQDQRGERGGGVGASLLEAQGGDRVALVSRIDLRLALRLDLRLADGESRRTTVQYDTNAPTVALAPGGNSEEGSKAISHDAPSKVGRCNCRVLCRNQKKHCLPHRLAQG